MSLVLSRLNPRPAAPSEEDRLRAEVRELRHKVRALEDALLGRESDALVVPVPRLQLVLLRLLMRHTRVSMAQCMDALEAVSPSRDGKSPYDVHTPMSRLRKFLRPHGVALCSSRFSGYWIEPADKARLRAVLGA